MLPSCANADPNAFVDREPTLPEMDGTDGWLARLELGFESDGRRTVLRHRRHVGPLTVQRGFYPEGDPCHAYLLHPPGGVVGGDRIELQVSVATGSHALATTPAAGKFYRSAGPWATQQQRFRLASGGVLEWLPALNILHGGARVRLRSRFELEPGARLLAWDLLGLGRPGSGDGFREGAADSRVEVWMQGKPLLTERLRLAGDAPILHAPWGMQGQCYAATLLAFPATAATVTGLRQALGASADLRWGCTLLGGGAHVGDDRLTPGLLVCRWLSRAGELIWQALLAAWSVLRPLVVGREACPPRIWST